MQKLSLKYSSLSLVLPWETGFRYRDTQITLTAAIASFNYMMRKKKEDSELAWISAISSSRKLNLQLHETAEIQANWWQLETTSALPLPLKLFTANLNLVHLSPKPRPPKLFLRLKSRKLISVKWLNRMALKQLQEVAVWGKLD